MNPSHPLNLRNLREIIPVRLCLKKFDARGQGFIFDT